MCVCLSWCIVSHIESFLNENNLCTYPLHTQWRLVQIFNMNMFIFFMTVSRFCESVRYECANHDSFCNDLQVFPIGSPLVSDVSRAVLNVTEGEKMKEIENEWLRKKNNCPDSNNQVSSKSLSLASFWGLFLIAGVASLLALIISLSMFLYKERRQILICFHSEGSVWRRFHHTLRIFDKKDLSSHTFRKSALQDRTGIDSVHVIGANEASPNTNTLFGRGERNRMEWKKKNILRIFSNFPCLEV